MIPYWLYTRESKSFNSSDAEDDNFIEYQSIYLYNRNKTELQENLLAFQVILLHNKKKLVIATKITTTKN